jgi:hypothetical protein
MRLDVDCLVVLAYPESGSQAVDSNLVLKKCFNISKVGAPEILRLTSISNHVERGLQPARSVINIVSEEKGITLRDRVTCDFPAKLRLGKSLYWYVRGMKGLFQRFRGRSAKATEQQQNSERGWKDTRQHLAQRLPATGLAEIAEVRRRASRSRGTNVAVKQGQRSGNGKL